LRDIVRDYVIEHLADDDMGALDFQVSADRYVARAAASASSKNFRARLFASKRAFR
jgi:hypothetical protein